MSLPAVWLTPPVAEVNETFRAEVMSPSISRSPRVRKLKLWAPTSMTPSSSTWFTSPRIAPCVVVTLSRRAAMLLPLLWMIPPLATFSVTSWSKALTAPFRVIQLLLVRLIPPVVVLVRFPKLVKLQLGGPARCR